MSYKYKKNNLFWLPRLTDGVHTITGPGSLLPEGVFENLCMCCCKSYVQFVRIYWYESFTLKCLCKVSFTILQQLSLWTEQNHTIERSNSHKNKKMFSTLVKCIVLSVVTAKLTSWDTTCGSVSRDMSVLFFVLLFQVFPKNATNI